MVEEIIDAGPDEKRTHVEYFARGMRLVPYRHFKAAEFGGLTLDELIAKDIEP
jgi:hypothetical protein